ncbi:hypothetical protein GCM10010319_57590 [Streptomyces blastmyceticus]|uniref:Uncharacterized protein n=1 Tax=Streptomyces blastmyceticus TaxID=68180 RepID=A0ABP3HLN4_9ACTN
MSSSSPGYLPQTPSEGAPRGAPTGWMRLMRVRIAARRAPSSVSRGSSRRRRRTARSRAAIRQDGSDRFPTRAGADSYAISLIRGLVAPRLAMPHTHMDTLRAGIVICRNQQSFPLPALFMPDHSIHSIRGTSRWIRAVCSAPQAPSSRPRHC